MDRDKELRNAELYEPPIGGYSERDAYECLICAYVAISPVRSKCDRGDRCGFETNRWSRRTVWEALPNYVPFKVTPYKKKYGGSSGCLIIFILFAQFFITPILVGNITVAFEKAIWGTTDSFVGGCLAGVPVAFLIFYIVSELTRGEI